jgi:hypothetical protein
VSWEGYDAWSETHGVAQPDDEFDTDCTDDCDDDCMADHEGEQ